MKFALLCCLLGCATPPRSGTDAGAHGEDAGGTVDSGVDAGRASDAGGQVIPNGIYDCNVVQVRCGTFACQTPRLACPLDAGVLWAFSLEIAAATVAVAPCYSCSGTWYGPGETIPGNGLDGGGFQCVLDAGMDYCTPGPVGYCSPQFFFVLPGTPGQPNPDGGGLQPGEIDVNMFTDYDAHCAPRH